MDNALGDMQFSILTEIPDEAELEIVKYKINVFTLAITDIYEHCQYF